MAIRKTCLCVVLILGLSAVVLGQQITIVYDDYPFQAGLKTGHGFSCLVRGMEKRILFDQGDRSIQLFKVAYGENYVPLGVGKVLQIL